ncbi:helix-turn-helix domain-containing protein [Ponticoccus alexandrii]|uniref:Helix-turn-helix domain-containing protein n=1 Tax=Ponticoccus alexandrii TaxID=1943633 RepID=A0ABX7FI37_9RHOB|nr:helix-turn-helix transcriptional regulator [Ponticoccus alexandrii]QRF69042.1 helix-turn-helix domain-containing protein [Ponticoccus alexandrii]
MTEIDSLLGQSIESRRSILGLERMDLAARVGLSAATIRDIEAGKRRPTARQLFDIAEALGLHAPEIFPSISDEAATTTPSGSPPLPGFSDAQAVAAHYHALSKPCRSATFSFLVALQLVPDQAYEE